MGGPGHPTPRPASPFDERLEVSSATPQRPALAPGVELVGRMQGSGYAQPQWLIQRQGTFIQVTELLYRVAEQADGTRTHGEIAAGVRQTTGWRMSADQVRELIDSKLVPVGVVAAAGSGAASAAARALARPRSPLQLGVRARVVGPRVIEPIAEVLQVFYAPPVLLATLAVALAAHAWLYLDSGVGAAVDDVLLRPGLLLVVLAVVLASAVFHELGHASALRYGGGRVRGMGVGIYLIYPVFFTDVTDSYRLGRWARVRTDLGGVYFHLAFSLAVIALATITGQRFLLLAAPLINLEMARQFIPFVRLDGYWLLADLTGIPDLFSQMGPFVRGLLHKRRFGGSELPELKPAVKAIFALYSAIAVPVLALLSYLLVTRTPEIVATAFATLRREALAFPSLVERGDLVAIVWSLLDMLMLALPILGLAYLVYQLARLSRTAISRVMRRRRGGGALPPGHPPAVPQGG